MSDTHLLTPDGTPIPHLGETVVYQTPQGWPVQAGMPVMGLVTAVYEGAVVDLTVKWRGSAWNDAHDVKHGAAPGQWRTVTEWERDG